MIGSIRVGRLTCDGSSEAKMGQRAPEVGELCIFLVADTLVILEILQASPVPPREEFFQKLLPQPPLV